MSTSAQSTRPVQPSSTEPTPALHGRARRPQVAADERPVDARVLLRAVPSLADVDASLLAQLAALCETLAVGEGLPLFRAGDECAGLYVVAEGQVRVTRAGDRLLHVVGPGRAVNELPLARGERHAASASAAEPSRVLFLARHAVEAFYRAHPDAAHALIQSLARRLRELGVRAHALTFRDVLPRLALLLASYAEQLGTPSRGGGVELELGRTQEELAHEIGTARESVSRAWGQLRDQGLIEPRRGHRVRIPDVQRLRDLAQP